MKDIFHYSKTPFAELHLHLGGAVNPRILWHKVWEDKSDEIEQQGFKDYRSYQEFFDKERGSLEEYLEMHEYVEPIQTHDRLDYFINRIMRGAFVFENLSYLEIRHCPYGRTNKLFDEKERISQMRSIVVRIHEAISKYSKGAPESFPIIVKQILCLHSKYNSNVNNAILDLAIEMHGEGVVCGLDIAGGENRYEGRHSDIVGYYKKAKDSGLKTTAHLFETKDTSMEMTALFDYLDRIGHGILLPLEHPHYLAALRQKGICLEICPTTYFKCGRFKDYTDPAFKKVFEVCEANEIDIVIGTDNSGMHNVRLQNEFENLLIHEIITYEQMEKYRLNAFKHAFGLTEFQKDILFNEPKIQIEFPTHILDIKI